MSTTYTYSINTLERTTADGIVYNVHFNVAAADETYSSSAYGTVPLAAPAEGDTVIPYADLTEEVVLRWTKDALGAEQVEALEARLQTELDEQAAPTKAAGVPELIMIALIRPILFSFLQSTQVKRMIVDLLRALAEKSDNTVDDQAVDFIERGLFGEV